MAQVGKLSFPQSPQLAGAGVGVSGPRSAGLGRRGRGGEGVRACYQLPSVISLPLTGGRAAWPPGAVGRWVESCRGKGFAFHVGI